VIDTESFLLDIEGQYLIFARTEGTVSADKLVSLYHFNDAMLVTLFCVPDIDFDHGVE
jgi:ABC-type microcin C transport system permease subunit YejB